MITDLDWLIWGSCTAAGFWLLLLLTLLVGDYVNRPTED